MPFPDDIPIAQRQSNRSSSSTLQRFPRWLVVLLGGGLAAALGGWLALPQIESGSRLARDPAPAATAPASEPKSTASEPPAAPAASAPQPSGDRSLPQQTASASSPSPTGKPDSLLGHYAYSEAPQSDLQSVGIYGDRTELMRTEAAQQFRAMATAAAQNGVTLLPISGFRSITTQQQLFFEQARASSLRPQERALVSAPPGYSEHHTGYAIDIGDGSAPNTNLTESFASTPASTWLKANAARFGFELSFPRNNPEGVSYEPWHWRFVGNSDSLATFYADRPLRQGVSAAAP
jgi:D-alanyl-D-alanine carboxypeptidase